MKWGVRRTPEQLGHKTSSKTKWRIKKTTKEQRAAEKEAKRTAKYEKQTEKLKRKQALLQQKTDVERKKAELNKLKEQNAPFSKKTNIPKFKSAEDLSDDELRQIINRYNLEKQYNQIKGGEKAAGKSWLKGMLVKAGQEVAAEYTKKAMKAGVEAILKKTNQDQNQDRNRNSSGSGSS